jgi:tRNA nucleotidyltransferase (CCA-adding enzyme)
MAPGADIAASIPPSVMELFERLRAAGFQAYVVGGSVRDIFLGREPYDWDLTTEALPEQVLEIFREARYENAFGTVAVRDRVEITTFRSDHEYADYRRPHHVEFGDRVELDLARRDFTANAMAWGGAPGEEPRVVDPFDGRADTERRVLRAVGDPTVRFGEDALRMLRAARLAAVLDFTIEPATLAALGASAELAAHLSGERIVAELGKLLDAPRPSIGLRILAETGVLAAIAPALDAQRGVAQNKIPGEDLWDHVVRSVDATAAAGRDRTVRWAALVHDIGKPVTAADGHFYGHDVVGADLAGDLLRRWHAPGEIVDDVAHLVRQHMFAYEAAWTDAAVRRFIAKVGPARLDDLFALREADNLGSGVAAEAGGLATLRSRVAAELAANVVLDLSGLAIRGDDLIRELGIAPGPLVGRILDGLLERVMNDPGSNRPETLIALARELASTMADNAAASTGRPTREPSGDAG